VAHTFDLRVEGGHLLGVLAGRQRRHPLTQPELSLTFVRTFADGISTSVLAAHRERVRWTARHDECNTGTGIGWCIRHLGQLYINRFTESVCDSAGNLLGVAEH
jgi:hypothetical protein